MRTDNMRESDSGEDRRGVHPGVALGGLGGIGGIIVVILDVLLGGNPFTHGIGAQTVKWFNKGFDPSDPSRGDTFKAKDL